MNKNVERIVNNSSLLQFLGSEAVGILIAREFLNELIDTPAYAYDEIDLNPHLPIERCVTEVIQKTNAAGFTVSREFVLTMWIIELQARVHGNE